MISTVPRSRGRRVVDAIGPYPIRPALLASTLGALSLLVTLVPNTKYWWQFDLFGSVFVTSLLIASGTAVWAILGKAWQQRHGVHWGSYIAFILMMGTTVPLVRIYYPAAPDLPTGVFGPLPPFIRAIVAMFLINMVINLATRRLQDQVDATQEALEIAREQQLQILTADEDARRQISSLLHDRVQAELIAVCLELRVAAQRLPVTEQTTIDPLIQRLETLRSLDLRNVARSLSPDLDALDLQTAIEELAMPFEASLLVEVDVDVSIDQHRHELGQSLLLACYRIVEQGLLNVAAHARASRVDVRLLCDRDVVRVSVVDDGIGLQPDAPRGLGSVVITTWVRAMDGTWAYREREGGAGTELYAELHAAVNVHV